MGAIAGISLFLGVLAGQTAETDPVVAGHAYSPDGSPAAGATVWLITSDRDRQKESETSTTTDPDGHFAFTGLLAEDLFGDYVTNWVVVRDSRGCLGWKWRFESDVATALRIDLLEVGDYTGRVVSAGGDPIADAELTVQSLSTSRFGERDGDHIYLYDALRQEYTVETRADGTFVLSDFPRTGTAGARVVAPNHASVQVSWDVTEPIAIPLEPAGRVAGKLRFEGDSVPVENVTLRCGLTDQQTLRQSEHDTIWPSSSEITVEPDGSFEADGLLPGRYKLRPSGSANSRVSVEASEAFEVKAGETTRGVELPASRGVAVRGRVVLTETGAGVGNAVVSLGWINPANTITAMRRVHADADGCYEGFIRPGNVRVALVRLPRGFLPQHDSEISARIDAAQDMAGPTFEVMPATSVDGIVVDEAGTPVSNAEVRVVVPRDFTLEKHPSHDGVKTRADGTFTVYQLDPRDTIPFRARTESATTEHAVIVVPEELTEPVRLVVAEEYAFRIRGRAVTSDGQPVPTARASIMLHAEPVSRFASRGGWLGTFTSVQADEAGVFETKALWPDIEYEVSVSAEGYSPTGRSKHSGAPGQVADLGMIDLGTAGREIAGRVLDSASQPVPNVHVFNEGDSVEGVSTQTSADGSFRLEGLFGGPAFIFADGAGYRFTMQYVESGQSEATVTLLKPDEPRPTRAVVELPTLEQQKQIAREILERAWKIPGIDGDQYVGSIVSYMARIDPDLAMRWSADLGGRFDAAVRRVLAWEIANDDPEQAITLLAEQTDSRVVYDLRTLVGRFKTTKPESALRLAEEAVTRARALDEPARSEALAQVGALVVQLGQADAGRSLIQQAADAAEGFGADGYEATARNNVAAALAPYDLERAVELVEPLTASRGSGYGLGRIAISLAAYDLERADRLLDEVDGSRLPEQHKPGMAYYYALSHPDRVEAFVEQIHDPDYRALAFGWAAAGVASHDRALAHRLIERGMDALMEDASGAMRWAMGFGRSGYAARLALHAKELDYPDMDVLIAKTLSMRPRSYGGFEPEQTLTAQVRTAAILALIDPTTARQLLTVLEPRWQRQELPSYQKSTWLVAWAVADPVRAGEMARQRLEDYKVDEGTSLWETGALSVVDVLTTPPERRCSRRSSIFLNTPLWFPDEDY